MATGGDPDKTNAMYSSLQQDKDPHHYQQLTQGKYSQKQSLHPASEADYGDMRYMDTGVTRVHYGSEGTGYVTPVQPSYMDVQTYTSPLSPHDQLRARQEYYNGPAIAPLGPQKTELYSETLKHASSPGTGRISPMTNDSQHAETATGKGRNTAQFAYSTGYNKGQHFRGARYANNPGDKVEFVSNDTELQENGMYDEIPADADRPPSRSSIHSASSIQPILPQQKVSIRTPNKRVILLICVVITVAIVIGVLVAIGISLSQRSKFFVIYRR